MNCVFKCGDCRQNNNVAEVALAKSAFLSLSPEEQVRAVKDIYGAEVPVVEKPEFVRDKLQELDEELSLLRDQRKEYYNRAIQMEQEELLQLRDNDNSSSKSDLYVGSENFHLMFLRAERFNAKLAAKKLTIYFEEKYKLFGEEKLARKIKQADLNDEERLALVSGVFTYIGGVDFAGRPVICARDYNLVDFQATTLKRMVFYVASTVMEDNEIAQKQGVVIVIYHFNAPMLSNPMQLREKFPMHRMLVHAIPARVAGAHNYHSDIKEHFLMNLILVMLSKETRARYQPHYAESCEECIVNLICFGIRPDALPINVDCSNNDDVFHYDLIQDFWAKQNELETEGNVVL